MLFNSYAFVLFLLILMPLYYRTPLTYRRVLLLGASYFFYSFWDYRFTLLLLLTSLIDFWVGGKIERAETKKQKKLFLSVSLLTNLGVLFFFKYFGLFAEIFGHFPTVKVLLPVGISFYTFQALSYVIDIYRGRIRAVKELSLFLLSVSYFPHLVAGPIQRTENLVPQLEKPRPLDWSWFWSGLLFITTGYIKKVLVGDSLAPIVEEDFSHWESIDTLHAWEAVILFNLQIFFDFSGYSDIAVGVSRWFGVDLVRNFRQPFLARSLRELWKKWNVSVSSWFGDYVYEPLTHIFGRVHGYRLNLIVTMSLCGLWHGASVTFLLWGFTHGALLSVESFLISKSKDLKVHIFEVLRTFFFCCVAIAFFRSPSVHAALEILQKMFAFSGVGDWSVVTTILFFIGVYLLFELPIEITRDELVLLRTPRAFQWFYVIVGLVVSFLFIARPGGQYPFIYFQF